MVAQEGRDVQVVGIQDLRSELGLGGLVLDGHADRFWALSLALMASDEGIVKPEIIFLGQ